VLLLGGLLVVDDDVLLARATRRALAQYFPDVRVAYDADSALRLIAERVPAVVLTDYEFAAGTADRLIQTLAREAPRTRVVLYSASQPERWKRLVDHGWIAATLVKPCIDLARLVSAVRGSRN
jgi:DNA-binding NarL/FixJ family response regulator